MTGRLIVLVVVGLSAPAFAGKDSGCSVDGRTADLSFQLTAAVGDDVRLSDHKGNVILIDFWATWCAPCRIEIPGFVQLYEKYQARGLSIIGISVDDPIDAINRFARQYAVNYPLVVGADRDDVKSAYGPLTGFPTAILIDRNGEICHHHTGYTPVERFDAEIQSLLR